jgi:type I restriction enzyme S subunit
MRWLNAPLGKIAPVESSTVRFSPSEPVWHLTLDQIESHTGYIINKKIAPASEAGTSTYVFDDGNVLYSKLRPYLNKVFCPAEPGISTTELVPLRPREGLVDRRYLTYYLRSNNFLRFANVAVAGVKMPRMIMRKFWEHEVPLPPPSEQKRIAEIIDQADELRKKRAQADMNFARITVGLFYERFGDPISNPRHLRKKKLGELIKVKSGEFLPSKDMAPTGEYPVYGGNGIAGYHSRFMFPDRMIVLGRVGEYCGVIHYTAPNCWVTDNALYVSERSSELDLIYLIEALKVANLNKYAGRAGQPLISGSRIYPVEILVPDLCEQQAFAQIVNGVSAVRTKQVAAGQKLQQQFDVILHRAFAGELTAKWREANLKMLRAEMVEQARLLDIAKEDLPC